MSSEDLIRTCEIHGRLMMLGCPACVEEWLGCPVCVEEWGKKQAGLEIGRRLIVELEDDYHGDGKFVVVIVRANGLLYEEWVFHTRPEAQEWIEMKRRQGI